MPATDAIIRSAVTLDPSDPDVDIEEYGTKQLEIYYDPVSCQHSIEQMVEDRNDPKTLREFSSYSTKLSIFWTDNNQNLQQPSKNNQLANFLSLALGNIVYLDLQIASTLLLLNGGGCSDDGGVEGDNNNNNNSSSSSNLSNIALLANEISKLVHLKELQLRIRQETHGGDRGEENTTNRMENMRLLGLALAPLPHLKKVNLCNIPHCWYLSQTILPLLERQPNPVLCSLYAVSSTKSAAMFATGENVAANQGPQTTTPHFLLACSRLTTLTLKMPMQQSYIDSLGQAVGNSTSLSRIQLWGDNADEDVSLVPLAEDGLQHNSSLRYLSVVRGHPDWMRLRRRGHRHQLQQQQTTMADIASKEAEAFAKVLANRNYTLERLEYEIPVRKYYARENRLRNTSQNSTTAKDENMIKFYVSLNRAGRAKLMGTPPFQQQQQQHHQQQQPQSQPQQETNHNIAPIEEWVRVLAQPEISVPIIYYFLQANLPNMFPSSTRPKDNNNKNNINNEIEIGTTLSPPKPKRQRR